MAACSSPSAELQDSQSQTFRDGKAAKKAIAKTARLLRGLLANQEEKIDALVQHGLLERNDAQKDVIKGLQEKIGQSPNLFGILLREIARFPDGAEVVKKLQDNCPTQATKSQAIAPVLGSLKTKLCVLKDMNSTDAVIKTAITETIAKEMKYLSNQVELMKAELSTMHHDGLMSPEIFHWATAEISEVSKDVFTAKDKVPLPDRITLSNDDLYHATLCCAVVNKAVDTEQSRQLLQSLSYSGSLKEMSISQSGDQAPFPRCMIAISSDKSKGTTCYIAFENLKLQKLVNDVHKSTFGKVFECQIDKFPTLYLEKIIKTVNRLVLTGFSFGGVLAQMLAAHLWLLPLTNTDKLTSNLICITFGQPLIQSDLLTHVAEIFPDFRKNVHVIASDDDRFPAIAESVDIVTSTDDQELGLSTVLEDLVCLQDFYLDQEQSSDIVGNVKVTPTNTLVPDVPRDIVDLPDPQAVIVQSKLERLLRSQRHTHLCDNSAATHHMIVHNESDVKLVQMDKSLEERWTSGELTHPESFDHHVAGAYYNSINKVVYDQKEHEVTGAQITSGFLRPHVETMKVTKYGSEAIIVAKGQKLWFVHSIKLSSATVKEPFQVQEYSTCFKTDMNNIKIPDNPDKREVVIYSYFHEPVQVKLRMEFDLNRLSPGCRKLAKFEPDHLLEFAFMMSLLERRPHRSNSSGSQLASLGESPPFFNSFKQFLHDIAAVVPYESILCTVAQCHDDNIIERDIRIIRKLGIEFPFSLSMYASLFTVVFKIQHETSIEANFLTQQPFEDCAYFMWSKAKYTKGISTKLAVDSFSEEVFTDPYMFGSQEILSEDSLYLQKMVQASLRHVNSLSEVEAVSSKSAADLYRLSGADSSSASGQEFKSLKSPIAVLINGREALHQNNDSSALHLYEEMTSKPQSYEETMKVLRTARSVHFDFCIRVLCGFIHQHVQVPFTEVNPMTFWKHLRYQIAPYSDILKDDSKFWASLLKRCQRAIAKGSQVADRTYNGKLKFLITNIVPESDSEAHPTPTSTEYSMYMLEKKLKEICLERKIGKEISIDRMVHEWPKLFKGCPIADIASSHRGLVSRWIKWSLMVHELRLTLENHITIAITGLVNSGKTQLIRSLFNFDVKAGTIESRRTIVPFMYTLAPDVEGVHVVDLPGADDSDKNVLRLTEFLRFILQVVVFVVSHDKAHTKDAIKWLHVFEKGDKGSDNVGSSRGSSGHTNEDSRPVLVCMTFADRLLAEMMEDDKYNAVIAKKDIEKHFKAISSTYYGQSMWKPNGKRTLGCYCLDLRRSSLSESDMRAVNIGVPSDVGGWLCQQLREELCACNTADQLEAYFKKSCHKL